MNLPGQGEVAGSRGCDTSGGLLLVADGGVAEGAAAAGLGIPRPDRAG